MTPDTYTGFFAETDLYEVKKADEPYDELKDAFFVKAEDLPDYTEDEKVYNDDGTLKMYKKGTFIYRLSGRSRQKSASYYTPEVLTKCLVKYALKELLKDKNADDILTFTVCEPALGSGAFLNEAINQLAEAYLDKKQKEIGIKIGHDDYLQEKQKVKSYIAASNVYGVDLNPIAVELAEVSLWLNTIYTGAQVPWFGMQLVTGNSLIGARRQVFDIKLLENNNNKNKSWMDAVSDRVKLIEKRPKNTVYHFLVPDPGMAHYTDKIIREMVPDEIKKINEWRKSFLNPFSENEIEQLKKLSDSIDRLWERHAEQRKSVRDRTQEQYSIFGKEDASKIINRLSIQKKDKIFYQEILSENVRNSSPYRRLKLVMDYWCALWFWPIYKADLLPSRDEFLMELSLILEGNVYDSVPIGETRSLFPDSISEEEYQKQVDEFGFVDVDKLCNEQRLKLVSKLSKFYHFHHWELEFAEIFYNNEGYDLILGNPPWTKVEWQERDILSEYNPLFVVRKENVLNLVEI